MPEQLHDLAERIYSGKSAGPLAPTYRPLLNRLGFTPFEASPQPEDLHRLGAILLANGRLAEAEGLLPEGLFLFSLRGLREEGRVEHRDSQNSEGSYAWCLSALSSLAVICDWIDTAPGPLEALVQEKQKLLEPWLAEVEPALREFPVLRPWWLFEKARAAAFRAHTGDATMHLQRILEDPLSLQQPGIIQRTLELLKTLDAPTYDVSRLPQPYLPATVADWERLLQALVEIPKLLECATVPELQDECVALLHRLLKTHQAFWIESEPDGWVARAYKGPPGFARFSRTLLEAAVREGGLNQDPVCSDPLESVILSEARAVLIELVPVLGATRAALYISHRTLEGRYRKGERELLTLVAQIVGSHLSARELHAKRVEADKAVLLERERLQELYDKVGLGIAWLDPSGRPVGSNPAFAKAHPLVSPETALWGLLIPQDQVRARRFFQEALQAPGLHAEVFRAANSEGQILWHSYQLEVIEGRPSLCTTQDVSSERWEDVVFYLEQERHWRASDLHDGPCQVAAAERLSGGDNSRQLDNLMDLMQWFRSPLYSGQTPQAAISSMCQLLLPEVEWTVECEAEKWTARLLSFYRVLQDFVEQAADHAVSEQMRVKVTDERQLIGRLEGLSLKYAGSTATQARLELHGALLKSGPDFVEVQFP